MKIFTPDSFAEHLLTLVASESIAMHEGLKIIAEKIEKTAKSEIGHYNKSYGNFPAWALLTESTISDKEKLGYAPPDNPLFRTGDLQASISHTVKDFEAIIGSIDQVMFYHEFGTSKMAMRPVLGPAVYRNKKSIQAILGAAVVSGFYGIEKIHQNLGYDFKINGIE